MKKVLMSIIMLSIFFNCFAQNSMEKDVRSLIRQNKCNEALAILVVKGVFSGTLYNEAKSCKPLPKKGNTADAQEFNAENDDLSPLPKLAKPIGNENITKGNQAFNKNDFEAALNFYSAYLSDNWQNFLNYQYEDYFDDMMTYS